MVNQQVLAGHWNEVRGKLQEKWAKLTDDDLRSFNGNLDQLVGKIQQRTGETRDAIERFLAELAEEGSDYVSAARDKAQEVADQMSENMRQGYESVRQGYAEAERVIQDRPAQAVAFAFGLGLLVGVGATLVLRERSRESGFSRGRSMAESFGRQMLDAVRSAANSVRD
jgi:uncharacterized protein YjbJ (UPF0337 family)